MTEKDLPGKLGGKFCTYQGMSAVHSSRLRVAFATGASILSCQAKTSITARRRPSFTILAEPNNGFNFAERRKSTLVLTMLAALVDLAWPDNSVSATRSKKIVTTPPCMALIAGFPKCFSDGDI